MMTPAIAYDTEIYPNIFSFVGVDMWSDALIVFEISDRRNDLSAFLQYLAFLRDNRVQMVGFNNINFDYPVIHAMMMAGNAATYQLAYDKATSIIHSNDRWGHLIWPSDRFIPQIDLFKIHHFDNVARSTSLKALQVNMRSESVEDLPYKPGTHLTDDQKDELIDYNIHDTTETKKFGLKSWSMVEFRRELSDRYNRDFTNHNDTKIGKDYFIMRLGDDKCYHRHNGKRLPNQTVRDSIDLSDVVFPYIRFQHPEFDRILQWFKAQTIRETKGVFTGVSCVVNGFDFDFGTGGIHGSIKNRVVRSDDDHVIIDLDVASYYPNIAIKNRLYPEHLGEEFCNIYLDTYNQRKDHAKGTPINAALKLALNGVYGDSNNVWSPFYDPKYTMSITINGQLLLCVLAEWLMLQVDGLEMIQVNTDGLTVRVPRGLGERQVDDVAKRWEAFTCLELERADYDVMAIRDVNNYLAVYTDGEVKRKGAYDWKDKQWHQDQSALVVPYAAEKALIEGTPVNVTIPLHTDPFDFMLRAKAPRGNYLMLGEREMQRTMRYYISKNGEPLVKIAPPVKGKVEGHYKKANGVSEKEYNEWHAAWGNVWNEEIHTKNKSVYKERRTNLNNGWLASECNHVRDFNWQRLDYHWYIAEAEKLVQPLLA